MRIIPLLLGALLVHSSELSGAEPAAPLQGAALLKTDLMGVFAHPDDETGVAATIASYAKGQGKTVAHVYCTRGEGGGNMVGTQSGAALGALREVELRDCLRELGVRHCFFLDRLDFAYTESLIATMQRWHKEETLRGLVRLVRTLRPEVMITMDPAPSAGQHGNHQAAGVLATGAFTAAADPARFPEQLADEGLQPWQTRKLYYSGWDETLTTSIDVSQPLPDGSAPWQVAAKALSNHRSQAFGNFAANPRMRRAQLFRLVKSVVAGTAETDLFRGLPAAATVPVSVKPATEPAHVVEVEFQSRTAIAEYHNWVETQAISTTARRMKSEASVVSGTANTLVCWIRNHQATESSGDVVFSAPPGWVLQPDTISWKAAAHSKTKVQLVVTPPAGATRSSEIVARITGTQSSASLAVNCTPLLSAGRLSAAPALNEEDQGWSHLDWVAIPHTNQWQGGTSNAADCSGRFRVGVHDRTLFLEVQVFDDVVVSNIAPDDIKGHWRSDSIEICLDPMGGSENALSCFKLGVFPFDSTGRVNAARDADARHGPMARTAPGTRLTSFRTSDGYRIRAAIPFADAGISSKGRIGFNVLIYDGDKSPAAPGENINKLRLAWSPRSGVQGRPEDWGRLDLN
ncbi:MAG: hypothetical protein FJ405_18840 [Verrucomicrobia bacterium]|nr:hypothetical protein [Verrucomicrobiota bacterium]